MLNEFVEIIAHLVNITSIVLISIDQEKLIRLKQLNNN